MVGDNLGLNSRNLTAATPAIPPRMVSIRVSEGSSVGVLIASVTVSINSLIRYNTTRGRSP